MLLFIQNLPWVLVLLGLVALVSFIIYRLIKDKKNGKTSCGCGCSGCAMRDACHSQKEKSQDS